MKGPVVDLFYAACTHIIHAVILIVSFRRPNTYHTSIHCPNKHDRDPDRHTPPSPVASSMHMADACTRFLATQFLTVAPIRACATMHLGSASMLRQAMQAEHEIAVNQPAHNLSGPGAAKIDSRAMRLDEMRAADAAMSANHLVIAASSRVGEQRCVASTRLISTQIT